MFKEEKSTKNSISGKTIIVKWRWNEDFPYKKKKAKNKTECLFLAELLCWKQVIPDGNSHSYKPRVIVGVII